MRIFRIIPLIMQVFSSMPIAFVIRHYFNTVIPLLDQYI